MSSVSSIRCKAVTTGKTKVDTEARRALVDKVSQPGVQATVRLLVAGTQKPTALAAGYLAMLRSVETPGVRFKLVRSNWSRAVHARPALTPTALNVAEIQTLTGWPEGSDSYPGLDRSGSRHLPTTRRPASKRIIGEATHAANRGPVGLSATDALRHAHVLGPSGVGKSTLLANMALQDIGDRRGVVVIDPKGDLCDDIVTRLPDEHLDRVVVLDPSRTDRTVGFNPLAVAPAQRELAVDGVVHIFRKLFADSWGPRTQDILHASLLTISYTDHASIPAIPRLLVDERHRRQQLRGVRLPSELRAFWSWFDALSDAERSNVIAPLLNKLRAFTLRTSLRAMLADPTPSFDPKTVFTRRRALLVPLRKGLIGAEAANLVGALLLARLWALTQERSAISQERRRPVFFYLDEFQDYLKIPMDLGDLLAQARGMGVGLTLAHQHLRQLDPDVRAAVLANAQNRIYFRLGHDDARTVARSLPPLEEQDLTQLPAYEAYASLLDAGQLNAPVSIRTHPPRSALRVAVPIRDILAERWGYLVTDPDDTSAGDEPDDGPVGIRRRGDQ